MTHRVHYLLRAVAIAMAATFASLTPAFAQDFGPAVKVNQVAYVPGAPKAATVVNSATSPLGWTIRNSGGSVVATGQTTVRGADATSGDNVHIADFSALDTIATGYVLSVGGVNSFPFDISADPIRRLRYDALAFFYHQRSGIAIQSQYVGNQYARPAGHVNVAPNRGDNAVPCRVSCGYTLDVRGGWYDAGDHGKYVVNGGISAWQLINEYERTLYIAGADGAALGDGTLAIPERGNGVPDILDEARWEVEFLLKMQVPDGRTDAGMVHHKIHDQNWTGLPLRPERIRSAAARRRIDRRDAEPGRRCRAGRAGVANDRSGLLEPRADRRGEGVRRREGEPESVGGRERRQWRRRLQRQHVTDEFYWAAAELYMTTGNATYRADVTELIVFPRSGFQPARVTTGGTPAASVTPRSRWCPTDCPHRTSRRRARPSSASPIGCSGQATQPGLSRASVSATTGVRTAWSPTTPSSWRWPMTSPGNRSIAPACYQALDYLFGRNPSTSPMSPAMARRRRATCTIGSGPTS